MKTSRINLTTENIPTKAKETIDNMECISIVIVLSVCLAVTYIVLVIRWILKKCRRQSNYKEDDDTYDVTDDDTDDDTVDMVDGNLDVEGGRSSKRKPTLDLHGKSRQEALKEVDDFIQSHRNIYNKCKNNKNRHVNIITGRGLHSVNNYPVLKNETQKYLKTKGLKYFETSKGGALTIDLKS